MARVQYNDSEINQHHQVMSGIATTLENSPTKRARTTLQAIECLDLLDHEGRPVNTTLQEKIDYVCRKLNCDYEMLVSENEVVFLRTKG